MISNEIMESSISILLLFLLVPEAWMDIRKKELNLLLMALAGMIGMGWHIVSGDWQATEYMLALIPGGLLCLSAYAGRSIGLGDGILFLSIGMIGGFMICFRLLLGSSILSMIAGLILHFIWKKEWKYAIPMAPFILAACASEILFG